MHYKVTLGKEVRHSLYRDYPGDEYWVGYNDLDPLPLLSTWKQLTIVTEQRGTLPDWFCSGTKDIVSTRVRTLCEEMEVAAEYLPVSILHAGERMENAYWVLHPLERIDCIDIKNSEFEMYGTPPNFTVKRYKTLAFIESTIYGKNVFRPLHDPAIYASSAFRDRIITLNLRVGFAPLPGRGRNAV